jgi:hypothetical protein
VEVAGGRKQQSFDEAKGILQGCERVFLKNDFQ